MMVNEGWRCSGGGGLQPSDPVNAILLALLPWPLVFTLFLVFLVFSGIITLKYTRRCPRARHGRLEMGPTARPAQPGFLPTR